MCMHLRASKYMEQRQMELKGNIDKSTITVGDLRIPSFIIDSTISQKISKSIGFLNTLSTTCTYLV